MHNPEHASRQRRLGVSCLACPLRLKSAFKDKTDDEVRFIQAMKIDHRVLRAGSDIIHPGEEDAELYTLFSGWAFRYKSLPDGRRQILNFLLPGDLVGLQGSVIGKMEHSVESLSPVVLCVFQRDSLATLFEGYPSLAFDITWLASREERMLDENLLSVGRRSALERAAYLIAFLYQRAEKIGMAKRPLIPISQQHVADTLGLSIVHTNKTLRKLAERGLIRWHDRACEVLDPVGLPELSGWDGLGESRRPLI